MPNNWKTYKLSEVTKLSTGFAFKSKDYENNGNLKVIRGINITEGKLRWGDDSRFWNHSEKEYSKYLIELDDIVIGMDGSKVGKNRAIVRKHDLPSILAQRVARIQAIPNLSYQKYIWQLINNIQFENYISNVQTGTSIPHISLGQIGNFDIKLPSYEEQKSIAQILSTIDDKIENNLAINKTLEEMAMALYKHWFVDFGPFQNGEFVDSELGSIPKGWEVKSLGSIVSVLGGYAFKSAWFKDTGVKVLKIKNINNNIVDINNCTCISEEISKTINPKFRIVKGDFLIAMTGAEVGKVGAVPDYGQDLWLNQRVGKLIDKNLKNASILIGKLLQTNDFYKVIQGLAYGSAQPNISTSDIEGIKIVLPEDKTILNKVIDEFVKSHDIIIQNLTENQTLTQLRDTLLPKLISGEVRLKEFRE